jgi:hypothetical protein
MKVELRKGRESATSSFRWLDVLIDGSALPMGEDGAEIGMGECKHHGGTPHLCGWAFGGEAFVEVCLKCAAIVAATVEETQAGQWLAETESTERLDEGEFYHYLLVALRLEGIRFLDCRDDKHQEPFRAVVRELQELQEAGDKAVEAVSVSLIPDPIMGRYTSLDEAIIEAARNGHMQVEASHGGASFLLDEKLAERLLSKRQASVQELLRRLAKVYAEGLRAA